MITKQQIFEAVSVALVNLVDKYNETNSSEVVISVEEDKIIVIDGGGVHGAYDVAVDIQEM